MTVCDVPREPGPYHQTAVSAAVVVVDGVVEVVIAG